MPLPGADAGRYRAQVDLTKQKPSLRRPWAGWQASGSGLGCVKTIAIKLRSAAKWR